MKPYFLFPCALITAALYAAPMVAQAASAAEQSCRACHKIDSKLVGPAFMDVAARYAKDSDAIGHLKRSMLQGSSGKWGSMAMPPNTGLTDAEAERFAHWIMSLNKPAAKP
ncbi:c-type cytochrome [Herbaspirillum sp. NPDC087042]|uniref:c-type cytochrome n=1 Tax=Herbaspirillum sp. NPDC087042 TaxID=3364004 RepID=UPI003812B2A1